MVEVSYSDSLPAPTIFQLLGQLQQESAAVMEALLAEFIAAHLIEVSFTQVSNVAKQLFTFNTENESLTFHLSTAINLSRNIVAAGVKCLR